MTLPGGQSTDEDAPPIADAAPSAAASTDVLPNAERVGLAERVRGISRVRTVGALAAVVILLDQISKQWALSRLADGHSIDVVGSLRFWLTWNTGTAFSLGSGRNLGPLIAVLALGVVIYLLWSGQTSTRLGAVAAAMVAGGAVGNLLDRAFRSGPAGAEAGFMGGAVVDFIDLQWWPVFNVADMGIVVGAVLLVLASLIEPIEPGGGSTVDGPTP